MPVTINTSNINTFVLSLVFFDTNDQTFDSTSGFMVARSL